MSKRLPYLLAHAWCEFAVRVNCSASITSSALVSVSSSFENANHWRHLKAGPPAATLVLLTPGPY